MKAPFKIIAVSTLREYWEKHPDVKQPLLAWINETRHADWETVHDVKQAFRTASVLKNNRIVFNIKGNQYRLIVKFWFTGRQVYIKFIGTHAEYDKVDADTVERRK